MWRTKQEQLNYADRKKIPYVVMAGEEEINSKKLSLKNMFSGEQELLSATELLNKFINE